jgi:DNA-binding MarR family transcriptional regulator
LNELTAMIVLPYRGLAAARRELERPLPAAPAPTAADPVVADASAEDPLEGVAMRLTYRTARVLEVVACRPGASNRQIAERAGVHDPGQISKLLTRLQRLGLLRNASAGHLKGEPNAWRLTPLGERVTERLALKLDEESRAA